VREEVARPAVAPLADVARADIADIADVAPRVTPERLDRPGEARPSP
jgi:hypothetical protein